MDPFIPPPLPTKPRTSPVAIWSLVLAFLGIVFCLPSVAGFICAIVALIQIGRSNGALRGTGLAFAGLITSLVTGVVFVSLVAAIVVPLAKKSRTQSVGAGRSLADERKGFVTHLVRRERTGYPVSEPPAGELNIVYYSAPIGRLPAYLSPIPNDGKKHPAIIWLTGGFSNSISDNAWDSAPPENDQTARIFRQTGVVTLYPSLRGGNENPGYKETFLGEVDDVIAAAEFLAAQPRIDRIYLGGHSTGGTLALLVAESTSRFRAVFSLGPVARIGGYGRDNLTFDTTNIQEFRLRNPSGWLDGITSPTFVFEGENQRSNIDSLHELKTATHNSAVQFFPVKGNDHFSLIAPLSKQIAERILEDTGPTARFEFQKIPERTP